MRNPATIFERLAAVKREILVLNVTITPYEKRLARLEREKNNLTSRLFIAKHDIHRADIEMSTGKGKPWFGHVDEFIKGIKGLAHQKRFIEWNDKVYLTKDVMKHGWRASLRHCELEHVPQ